MTSIPTTTVILTRTNNDDTKTGATTVQIQTPNLLLRPATPSDIDSLFPIFGDATTMRYWSEPPHPSIERTTKWVNGMIRSGQNGITDFIISLRQQVSSPQGDRNIDINEENSITKNENSQNDQRAAIGKIGIYSPPPSNEIGFLISRDQWGKGLGYEVLSSMLDYLFNLPSLPSHDDMSGETSTNHENGEPIHTVNLISGGKTSQTGSDIQEQEDKEQGEQTEEQKQNEKEKAAERFTTLTPYERECGREWRYPSITADVDPRNVACIALLIKAGFEEIGRLEKTWCIAGQWVDSVFFKLEREEWVSRHGRTSRKDELGGER